MATTFDIRVWKTQVYQGKRGNTYRVLWRTANERHGESFGTSALADSFRAKLLTAARDGEAFDIETGLPLSMQRPTLTRSWYEHACAFADMKWPRVAATTRRTHAEALTAITVDLLTTTKGAPDGKLLRLALGRWAFNTARRNDPACPPEVRAALSWVEQHTQRVSALAKPEVLRALLDGLTVRLDGAPAAASVVGRRRRILNTAVEYAVERGLIPSNPLPALKWRAPTAVQVVDRRSVANPVQVRTLLAAVAEHSTGERLVAFFGCLYYAGMRPEEAAALCVGNLAIPAEGWGEIQFSVAEPHAGREWTNSGENRDRRQLKQRAVGESRTAPCPPELTALLNAHVARFGTGQGGRLFVGQRNHNELPKGTINRVWRESRRRAFTGSVAASPLARTPYDLRHAAVSTWLNGGVPATDVAMWAGHSVEVLLRIYAKCLDGGVEQLRQRVDAALGHDRHVRS
jgi:integrase